MGLFQVVCMGLVAAVARSQELQNCSAGNVPFTVGSTEDAAALATALECSNGDFAVQWVGEVFVAETIRVTSGTHLDITGAETGGMADGLSATQLFVVEGGSTLHLSDMTLARGNASFGGAIYSKQSSVSFGGNTSFISNSAMEDGGAIYADESTVSWDDDGIRFVSNSAVEAGGAISAWWGSAVSWDGNGTLFISNSAADGGAIDASLSTVSWDGGGTQFLSNSASSSGGAISASWGSTVSWGGDGTQFGSNFAQYGGAISAWESTVVWDGEGTQFSSNSASYYGGAIYASSSNVSWDGSGTQFGSNSANSGGAISAWESTVFWHGDATQFSYNSAIDGGGAILAWESIVSWGGDNTEFVSNSASSSSSPSSFAFGGAIEAWESTVSWDGDSTQFFSNSAVSGGAMYASNSTVSWDGDDTQFGSNSASGTEGLISASQYGGGAIYATDGSTVSWLGDGTRFSSNFAAEDGGAIYALDSSTVSGDGTATFDSNVAGTNGGALAIAEHTFLDPDPFAVRPVYADATFVKNSAASGGALHLSNSRALHFINATFRSNSAGAGGAVFAYVAGDENYPIDFDECVFSGNQANGSGGAVETLAGLQRFFLCEFEGNSAGLGGALSLGGTAWLSSCGFLSNSASLRGPAVFAAGVVEEISFASFEGNELLCAIGSYQQGKRYDTVCLDCPEWDECLGCTIQEESVTPTCEAPLEHTTATGPGTTVETLAVDKGYWRTSRKSGNILACYNAEACTGGQTGADGFCAPGYAGSYCAVCDTDYSPSLAHTCTRCSVSRRHGFIAATVIAALVAIFAIVKLVRYLLSNELEGEEGVGWFHRRVLSAVPVQALKIIVVAWQILTQFAEAAHVTFPGVYQDFLSGINVFNFDLGSVFAGGCLWPDMDFHDRLLVNTTGPLVVVGFLAMTYWIAVRRNSGTTAGQPVERIRQKHLTALVLFTFLIYSSVSTTVFQTFACETLDDEIEYLRADYRIHCTDAKHKALEVYAGIMVFVYPFGIPLLYAVLLFQRRGVLAEAGADKTVAQSTAGLWEPYRSERFYYEVVECGRRIMLTGVVVFIFPGDAAQIAITLLTTFVFLLMFEVMSPYKSEFDTWLSRGGHVIVFFSMFDALLLKVDVSDESDESQAVFAGVLVTGHVLMVLAIVVEVVGICYASGRKQAVIYTVVSLLPVDLGVEPALELI